MVPRDSAWFSFFDGSQVVPLRQQAMYAEDWIGLKVGVAVGWIDCPLGVTGDWILPVACVWGFEADGSHGVWPAHAVTQ